MDKSWINKLRSSTEYLDGVQNFIKFAFEKSNMNGKILCPCQKCVNGSALDPKIVEEHLVWNGFLKGYTEWVLHGEFIPSCNQPSDLEDTFNFGCSDTEQNSVEEDDIRGLLRDALGHNIRTVGEDERAVIDQSMHVEESIHADDTAHYDNLVKDCDQELYPGCKNFTKISFLLHLLHLKYLNGWSSKSFTMLLQLLKDAFPEGVTLPSSSYEAKKLIKELDLGYEKIHSCPNDCILYRGENRNQESCRICGTPRWGKHKDDENDSLTEVDAAPTKKKPAKILRYFPLIPRLKRMFASPKTASSMRWHDEGRTKDGMLRHPADSSVWKAVDDRHPEFASDARSVRLGLATDGSYMDY
ncbi:uncharacterized protein LOC120108694 [Phoenix dactylifera]|uniref:Uncharacterized protein LOC120108694 n=1 Tax=Phoenix dactylifera TaxID=42345 RepID=A0A8B8ZVH6_PHODC|nr:uncharacterized protein LOC120108694 [Phoenix dactylifera]